MSDSKTHPHVDIGVLRRVIVAASLGNFVEWFDFAIYGFLATVIASQFFPAGDPTVALLQTFAVFAVAFALRPLGGVFFGIIGDKVGRKKTLSMTILLMAGSTTVIGLLPSFAAIGLAAPLILMLARCVQGFSAGGEYAGAAAYVTEHAPSSRKASYASFLPVSTFLAFAFAAVISFLLSSGLSEEAMNAWGWRIPFLAAAPLGLFGFYLRYRLNETPLFQNLDSDHETPAAPLRETLRTHFVTMLKLGGFISATALSFYIFTTYMSTYIQVEGGLSQAMALLCSLVALLLSAALCPFVGRLSDRIGRKKTMIGACIILIGSVIPAFSMAGSGDLSLSLAGQCLLAIGAVACNVVTVVLLSELFPTRVRYTASAITYNVSYTVFGGTAPFMATYLIAQTGAPLAPGYYLAAIAVIALIAAATLPETSRRSLSEQEPAATSKTVTAA